jgi:hypothetical protein
MAPAHAGARARKTAVFRAESEGEKKRKKNEKNRKKIKNLLTENACRAIFILTR